MPETFSQEITFSGRTFSTSDIGTLREITHDFPTLSLNELAKTICELLEWKRPNGGLKSHECRIFLERLQNHGLVCLPTLRNTAPHNPHRVEITAQSNPQPSMAGSVGQWTPLILYRVRADDHSRHSLWTQYIERYHYLGYRVPFGANMRYLVFSEKAPHQALACLLFSSPAWKMALRDQWIGWSDTGAKTQQILTSILRTCHQQHLPAQDLLVDLLCSKNHSSSPWLHLAQIHQPDVKISYAALSQSLQRHYRCREHLLPNRH